MCGHFCPAWVSECDNIHMYPYFHSATREMLSGTNSWLSLSGHCARQNVQRNRQSDTWSMPGNAKVSVNIPRWTGDPLGPQEPCRTDGTVDSIIVTEPCSGSGLCCFTGQDEDQGVRCSKNYISPSGKYLLSGEIQILRINAESGNLVLIMLYSAILIQKPNSSLFLSLSLGYSDLLLTRLRKKKKAKK